MTSRTYTIPAQVDVTVNDDGTVTVTTYLSDATLDLADEGATAQDILRVDEVLAAVRFSLVTVIK